jgi:hypothetical protein
VHTGQFYRPDEKEQEFLYFNPPSREEHGKGSDSLAVYLFLVNFMDRVFLKLLGYSGPYINTKILSPTYQHASFRDYLD